MEAMKAQRGRTPVAFFHIVNKDGVDMGWLGYCEAIGEAMIPVLLHPNGVAGAEQRSLTDPPQVVGVYNGDGFVPHSWIRSVLTVERDRSVVDAMKVAAGNCLEATRSEMPAAP